MKLRPSLPVILQIARREFIATVMTKAFLIGLLVLPAIIAIGVLVVPLLVLRPPKPIQGQVAIVDANATLVDRAKERLTPAAFAQRQQAIRERVGTVLPVGGAPMVGDSGVAMAAAAIAGTTPSLTVVHLPAAADLAAEKRRLIDDTTAADRRLVLVVVHPNAVTASAGDSLGGFDLYVRAQLDDRLIDDIRRAVTRAIVDERMAQRGLNAGEMRALTDVKEPATVVVEEGKEEEDNEFASQMLPMAFMMLMLMAIMSGGGQLLSSTVEEKSSRVVEVLLAAVTPTEFMAGKILGQFSVALLLLSLYGGLGIAGLVAFSAMGLLDPVLLVYLGVFFVLGFIIMSSIMAAIGSAVSDIRDAQTLLTPVMLINILPMMLWAPISADPNSTFARVLSFVPPVSPFVMLLRASSKTPPPTWEIVLGMIVTAGAAVGAIWFAGRVFRVGLLMQGKPPNFRTLIRWARTGG